MRTKRLIKTFTFDDESYDESVIGPNTRINLCLRRATLLEDSNGRYSTAPDLFVSTRITNPQSVRGWIGFEAKVVHKRDSTGAQITSVGFRLYDGTNERYWDGAAWSIATPGDWNTEQEVADNIATFPWQPRQIRVVVNMATTDARQTPEVEWVKVLYSSDVESFQEDILRSFIVSMKASIRPIGRLIHPMPATGSTVAISTLQIESGYQIVDVDSVFNETTDPTHLVDLFQSFAAGTITLTGSVPGGQSLFIRFVYAPRVIIHRHQDFIEAPKLPAIGLSVAGLVNASERTASDWVANKGAGTAVKLPAPLQGDLEIGVRVITENDVDNHRLSDQLKEFFAKTPHLKSTAIDEAYRLWLVDEFTEGSEPGQSGVYESEAMFRVASVCFWNKPAENDFVVSTLNMRFPGEQNPVTVP